MTHDVYDTEVWNMIDEEDAILASHQEAVYEYLKDEKDTINKQKKRIQLIQKTKRLLNR